MARRTTDRVFNGQKARELREEADLSVRELAQILEEDSELAYAEDTLRNVELGYKQPSVELSLAWANALDVPRSDLLMDAPELSDTTP
jgi:transcriptional regulator with XRE-family HTH domain